MSELEKLLEAAQAASQEYALRLQAAERLEAKLLTHPTRRIRAHDLRLFRMRRVLQTATRPAG